MSREQVSAVLPLESWQFYIIAALLRGESVAQVAKRKHTHRCNVARWARVITDLTGKSILELQAEMTPDMSNRAIMRMVAAHYQAHEMSSEGDERLHAAKTKGTVRTRETTPNAR